ncbi:MAG: hypothetical protein HY240_03085 [Actinobacteria bacterium]|nr:hypothetical protein [Actinomycetota bacterium]
MNAVDVGGFALVALILAVPGFGVTLAVAGPGDLPLEARLAVSIPAGFALLGALMFSLVIAHRLVAPWAVAFAVVGTVAVWLVGWRRHRFRDHLAAWRSELREDGWTFAVFGVLLLAFVAVRLTYGPIGMLAPTSLRYWADGVEISDTHGLPARSLQWDTLIPPTVSKIVLNSVNASARLLFGREPTHALSILLAVNAVGLFLAGFGLARAIGLRRTAPLVPLALFLNVTSAATGLAHDLSHYLAEDWGRLLILGALVLAIRAIRGAASGGSTSASPSDARACLPIVLASAAMMGIGAGTHLIPLAVGGLFLVCYGLGALAAFPSPRGWVRLAVPGVLTFGVIAAIVLLTPGGDLGFQGAAGSDAYLKIRQDLGLPANFDPTLFLVKGTGQPPPQGGTFYYSPGQEYQWFASDMVGGSATHQVHGVASLAGPALLVVALLVGLFGGRPLRAVAIACVLFAIGLLGTGLAFLARYDLFALADFGRRRLFDYSAIPVVLLLASLIETGVDRAVAWTSARPRLPRALAASVGAVALALGAVAMPAAVAPSTTDRSLVDLASWIHENVPCEGRILADRRTLATFQTLADRAGVLEGMGPHVRPDVLELALRQLFEARAFFTNPLEHQSYLADHGVAVVVVSSASNDLAGWMKVDPQIRFRAPSAIAADEHAYGYPETGSPSLPSWQASSALRRLAEDPALKLVYVSSGAMAFEVIGFQPTPGLPSVASQPGFGCP